MPNPVAVLGETSDGGEIKKFLGENKYVAYFGGLAVTFTFEGTYCLRVECWHQGHSFRYSFGPSPQKFYPDVVSEVDGEEIRCITISSSGIVIHVSKKGIEFFAA